MEVSRPKTQFMDFTFVQTRKQRALKYTRGITGKSYSFQMPRDEYRRGMWYANGDHKAGGLRLDKLEEIQWSTLRQKDASETEWESLHNSDQASNHIGQKRGLQRRNKKSELR